MSILRNALAIAGKELQVLFKDKGNLAVLFLMPLVLSSIMMGPQRVVRTAGETAPDEEPALQIEAYLVNEDSGPYGAQVAEGLKGISTLALQTIETAAEADRLVAEGERSAAIVIPAGFSDDIDAYVPTEVQVILDPTQGEASGIVAGIAGSVAGEIAVLGEIQYGIRAVLSETGAFDKLSPDAQAAVQAQTLGIIWMQAQEMRQNPIVAVKSRELESEEEMPEWNPFSYSTAGFTVMFAFFLIGIIAESLLKEQESGAFRRLLSSPLRRGSIILGKILAYMVIVFLQVAMMFAVSNLLYDMPLGSSFLGMLVLTVTVALAASALGLMIGSLVDSSKKAGNAGTLLGFVLMLLGGCIYPTFWREGFLKYVALATPHAHAVMGYMELMTGDGGLVGILPYAGVLLAMAAVFFGVATARLKFE